MRATEDPCRHRRQPQAPRLHPARLLRPGLVTLTAALVLSSCGGKQVREVEVEDEDVIALVDDEPIRTEDLLAEAAFRRSNGRPVGAKDDLLLDIINTRRLVAHAKARGLDRDPEFVRAWTGLLVGSLKKRELTPALDQVEVTEEELRAAHEGAPGSFEEAEPRLRQELMERKREEAFGAFQAEVASNIEVRIFHGRLEELDLGEASPDAEAAPVKPPAGP